MGGAVDVEFCALPGQNLAHQRDFPHGEPLFRKSVVHRASSFLFCYNYKGISPNSQMFCSEITINFVFAIVARAFARYTVLTTKGLEAGTMETQGMLMDVKRLPYTMGRAFARRCF